MATLTIPEDNRTITEFSAIKTYLAEIQIPYEQWQPNQPLSAEATADEILAAYADDLEPLKQTGGYGTADVIDIWPDTPNLEGMLAKFSREHWHDEDEVRFIVAGNGVFHINPKTSPVVAVEVNAGDLLVVPRGTFHWFGLCADRRIRAIRLFQDPAGWTPHYTESLKEQQFAPEPQLAGA